MKVGILTFHRAHNYGAVLQCYALSETLKTLGHDVEVIDYLPKQFAIEYSLYPFRLLKGRQKLTQLAKLICVLDLKLKRRKGFNDFIKLLPLTKAKYNDDCLPNDYYDYIIFGSDQIWNPLLTNKKDKVFCGDFEKKGAKFISYAASASPKVLTMEYENYYRGIIDRFDRISTRENSLTYYLNAIRHGVSQVVLDPVFLLSKEEWSKIAIKPIEREYVLIYTVPQHSHIRIIANKIAQERGLKVIEIRPTVNMSRKGGIKQTVSPREFLGYIMDADYIVTTSFHGTAFSIIFQRQFVTLSINKQLDDRACNLLKVLGLENRLVDPLNPIISDYNILQVQSLLNAEKQKSISYIQNTIK